VVVVSTTPPQKSQGRRRVACFFSVSLFLFAQNPSATTRERYLFLSWLRRAVPSHVVNASWPCGVRDSRLGDKVLCNWACLCICLLLFLGTPHQNKMHCNTLFSVYVYIIYIHMRRECCEPSSLPRIPLPHTSPPPAPRSKVSGDCVVCGQGQRNRA